MANDDIFCTIPNRNKCKDELFGSSHYYLNGYNVFISRVVRGIYIDTSLSIPRSRGVAGPAEAYHALDRSRRASPTVLLSNFFHADASHIASIGHLVLPQSRRKRETKAECWLDRENEMEGRCVLISSCVDIFSLFSVSFDWKGRVADSNKHLYF